MLKASTLMHSLTGSFVAAARSAMLSPAGQRQANACAADAPTLPSAVTDADPRRPSVSPPTLTAHPLSDLLPNTTMQSLKIDLLKLAGARPFTSKDGTAFVAIPLQANAVFIGEKAHYLELTLIPNRDGPDKYGYAGFAAVNLTKERREAGEKGPIIGNWKPIGRAAAAPPPVESAPMPDDGDDIPF
jgi:hypothetical protein